MNLVLSMFSVNLPCENLGISKFTSSISLKGSLFEKKRFVSSANRMSLASDETLQISLMYIRKIGVPKLILVGLCRLLHVARKKRQTV